jgi:mono/diheme cytochrome c family protein
VKCHGADGTGSTARGVLPDIPNFTKAVWQSQLTDAQLMASILDGRRQGMPPVRGKISEEQVRGLVAYVRSLAPTTAKSSPRQLEDRGLASFNERYGRLKQQRDDLRRQYHEVPRSTPGGAPSTSSESRKHQGAWQSSAAAPGTPASRHLFDKRCVKCHGADGTGSPARDLLAEIPDFTRPSWQAQRTDAQLSASILNGKGQGMPPQRGKINEVQASGLVAHVRAFALNTAESGQRPKAVIASTEPPKANRREAPSGG